MTNVIEDLFIFAALAVLLALVSINLGFSDNEWLVFLASGWVLAAGVLAKLERIEKRQK